MGFHKYAALRYRIIDEALSTGRIFSLSELKNYILKRLSYDGMVEDISFRQIQEDIRVMRSPTPVGFDAPIVNIKNVGYRYRDKQFSIYKSGFNNQERKILSDALSLLSYNKNLLFPSQIDSILNKLEISNNFDQSLVLKESTSEKGLEFVPLFLRAIRNKSTCNIEYKPYNEENSSLHQVNPLFLKEYRGRIYLIGYVNGINMSFALDRIVNVEILSDTLFVIDEIEYKKLKDSYGSAIGASIPRDSKIQKVVIKASDEIVPYLISRPIHSSQKLISKKDGVNIFELTVHVNIELKSEILRYGKNIVVLEPKQLIDEIRNDIELMKSNYKN